MLNSKMIVIYYRFGVNLKSSKAFKLNNFFFPELIKLLMILVKP